MRSTAPTLCTCSGKSQTTTGCTGNAHAGAVLSHRLSLLLLLLARTQCTKCQKHQQQPQSVRPGMGIMLTGLDESDTWVGSHAKDKTKYTISASITVVAW